MRFYSFALQKLNNSLVMNLLWESSLYQGLPFLKAKRSSELYDLNKIRRSLKNLIRSGKEKDFQAVHSVSCIFRERTGNIWLNFMPNRQSRYQKKNRRLSSGTYTGNARKSATVWRHISCTRSISVITTRHTFCLLMKKWQNFTVYLSALPPDDPTALPVRRRAVYQRKRHPHFFHGGELASHGLRHPFHPPQPCLFHPGP